MGECSQPEVPDILAMQAATAQWMSIELGIGQWSAMELLEWLTSSSPERLFFESRATCDDMSELDLLDLADDRM